MLEAVFGTGDPAWERPKTCFDLRLSRWISARYFTSSCLPASPVENSPAENFLASSSEDRVAAQQMLSHLPSKFYLITQQLLRVAVPAF